MGASQEDCKVREHVNRVLNKLLIIALSLILFYPLMLRIVQPLTALLKQQSRTPPRPGSVEPCAIRVVISAHARCM